jgi:hypothetical protein
MRVWALSLCYRKCSLKFLGQCLKFLICKEKTIAILSTCLTNVCGCCVNWRDSPCDFPFCLCRTLQIATLHAERYICYQTVAKDRKLKHILLNARSQSEKVAGCRIVSSLTFWEGQNYGGSGSPAWWCMPVIPTLEAGESQRQEDWKFKASLG